MDEEAPPGLFADHDAGTLKLQSVVLESRPALRPLYWRSASTGIAAARLDGHGAVVVPAGGGISFDTYFGGFFEHQWRLHTRLDRLTLHLDLDARAWLRVWRRTQYFGDDVLLERSVMGQVSIELPQDVTHFRQAGLLWFELESEGEPFTLRAGRWTTTAAAPARLAVCICTFNREAALAAVLGAIAGHPDLETAVGRVIVVNQGRPGLGDTAQLRAPVRRLGSRLHVFEQGNLGGAGGFGRAMLEALDDPAATHICLLDDDVALEPDCLLRMAAFLALAHDGVALGGHMLDSIQPRILYEAGAVMHENWALQPLNGSLDLGDGDALGKLLDSTAMDYNGWWMFGFSKRLLETEGMPLPCFIRGDDVEFGMRLHRRGVHTVSLPGVGVWHEPFYLKLGSWQLYYETRNALFCAALHQDFTPHRVAVRMMKRLLIQLLTFRYYGTALILRGMDDFMAGPGILDRDPRPLHASIAKLKDEYPQAWTRRGTRLATAPIAPSPAWRLGFVLAMIRILIRNWTRATDPRSPPQLMQVENQVWFRVAGVDNVATETYWDEALPTFHRDRATFRRLFVAGLRSTWRLYRSAATLQRTVQDAAPRLTSVPFWRTYLRVP